MQHDTIPPSALAIAYTVEHLRRIREHATDLETLLFALDKLPREIEADALRTLARIDMALGGLVQAVGEAGPGEDLP